LSIEGKWRFADQPLATKVFLGETALRVGIGALFANCPKLTEDLPNQDRSADSVEVFQIFVGALEGTAPVLTAEGMQEQLLLCNKFVFFGLPSRVAHFISAHSVANSEAQQCRNDMEDET
jgi:hypothetical protein